MKLNAPLRAHHARNRHRYRDNRLGPIGRHVSAIGAVSAVSWQPQSLGKCRSSFDQLLHEPPIRLRTLQKRGTQVVLFELPVHPSLEDTPRARQIRSAFRATFPDLGFVSADELGRGEPIRTVDGVHLALDESSHVAASLASHHSAACASGRTGPS